MKVVNSKEKAKKLYSENEKLAYYITYKKFAGYISTHPSDSDDIFNTARMALWKSCLTYDTSKGFKFSSYASTCITHEIIMYIGRNEGTRVMREAIPLSSEYTNKNTEDTITLLDIISNKKSYSIENSVINKIYIKELYNALSEYISKKSLDIFFEYNLNKAVTYSDIGKRYNMIPGSIDSNIHATKLKIQKLIKENNKIKSIIMNMRS